MIRNPDVEAGYGVWRSAAGDKWVIFAQHSILAQALKDSEPVLVRARDGRLTEVAIEHVTDPRRDGTAYGWPLGTRAYANTTSQLPPVGESQPPRIRGSRRHSGTRRATRRK